MRFALSINQFVAPSQVDKVTRKCRKEGKKCFSSVWLDMRVNDCYRKKGLIDQLFSLQMSGLRPRQLMELTKVTKLSSGGI